MFCHASTLNARTNAPISPQAGVLTQDVYEFADSVNRTIIAGYHQTIGFSGGYILVRSLLLLPVLSSFSCARTRAADIAFCHPCMVSQQIAW